MGLAYITKEEHARFLKQAAALADLVAADVKLLEIYCSNCFYQPEPDITECDDQACSHYGTRAALERARKVMKEE